MQGPQGARACVGPWGWLRARAGLVYSGGARGEPSRPSPLPDAPYPQLLVPHPSISASWATSPPTGTPLSPQDLGHGHECTTLSTQEITSSAQAWGSCPAPGGHLQARVTGGQASTQTFSKS